jgi:hypothetical protein
MTLTLEGLGPPASLRLREPVLGIDPSTLRMSAGVLEPRVHVAGGLLVDGDAAAAREPRTPADPGVRRDPRVAAAARGELGAVRACSGRGADGRRPKTVHVSSFYVIGVLLAAIGDACPEAEVVTFPPPRWKLLATGKGYAPGLPKTASRSAKRTAELARIEQWARDACGWTGTVGDESAGLGIATALGVELCRT